MIIKRRNLTFKFLQLIEQELMDKVLAAREVVLSRVDDLIRTSTPDMDEYIVEGSMKKSLGVDTALRRAEYGAPTSPQNLVTDLGARELLSKFPVKEGEVYVNWRGVKEEGKFVEKWVEIEKLVYFAKPVDLGKLREVLTGLRQEVRVASHGEDWTVTQGQETVLAAHLMELPALFVQVYQGGWRIIQKEVTREVSLDVLMVSLKEWAAPYVYRIPLELEPLAEEARKISLPGDFICVVQGQQTEEERTAQRTADDRERIRVKIWVDFFTEYRRTLDDEEVAASKASKNLLYKKYESVAIVAIKMAAQTKQKWDRVRGYVEEAVSQILGETDQDDKIIPLETEELKRFWTEANKVNLNREQGGELSGVAALGYEEGQSVEVLDGKGNWQSARVVRIEDYMLLVERADGQQRRVIDVSRIRRLGTSVLIDTGPSIWYNIDMKTEIKVDEFGVVIPAGSNSLRIEQELVPITEEMNRTPLVVNEATWKRSLEEKASEVEFLVTDCRVEAGNLKFRPNASADCIREFYEVRGLPVQKVLKSGAVSMDADVVGALAAMGDPLATKVLVARTAMYELSQLNAWKPYAEQGFVQAVWNSLGTPMGRYTADSPNLQNRILAIRGTIEAPVGWKLISWDLGAAEYVTWASLSGDPVLSDIFQQGRDVHTEMAERLAREVPTLDLRGTEPRKFGKVINFALCYLMQDWTLAKKLGVSLQVARQIMEAYRSQARVAVRYMNAVLEEAKRTEKVATQFGRQRYFPGMAIARGPALHGFQKTAWHHVNCGTTAEVLKIKTIRMVSGLKKAGLYQEKAKVALNMHDEIILLAADEAVAEIQEIGDEAMARPVAGFLSYKVDSRVGQSWLSISK